MEVSATLVILLKNSYLQLTERQEEGTDGRNTERQYGPIASSRVEVIFQVVLPPSQIHEGCA